MKLKPIPPQKMIAALVKIGYAPVRQKGSHLIMENKETNRIMVVPMHNRNIGKGLIRRIIQELGIEREVFLKLLYED